MKPLVFYVFYIQLSIMSSSFDNRGSQSRYPWKVKASAAHKVAEQMKDQLSFKVSSLDLSLEIGIHIGGLYNLYSGGMYKFYLSNDERRAFMRKVKNGYETL